MSYQLSLVYVEDSEDLRYLWARCVFHALTMTTSYSVDSCLC